jgi:PAS domain-containing protein
MATTSMIHPSSFLGRLCAGQPLITSAGKELLRRIPFHRWDERVGRKVLTNASLVSVDNGNDAFKGAMLHVREPFLQTKRIVTAYAPARTIRGGEGVTTWQVNDSEPFWIGEDAILAKKAESLPIGFTEERLPDERYQRFMFASLVELLRVAGYGMHPGEFQGEHDLYVSFGIPNEEMTLKGPKETVRHALRAIFNTTSIIRRIDEQGQVTTWSLRLVEITPYPQSFASFATWYYTLDGTPIETDIVKHVTLDIGGGQFHDCEVDILHQAEGRPKLRMTASLLGEGTIAMARAARDAIRAQYPGVRLSDAEAQQVLISGTVTLGGRRTRVDDIVTEVIVARSQNLFSQMLPLLQEEQSFLMFTGGGSLLLAQRLEHLVKTKRSPQSVLFVPKAFAPVLNAVGGYALVQSTAQKVVERMNIPTPSPQPR